MRTVLIGIWPDRRSNETAIRRVMRHEGRTPQEGRRIFVPELGRGLVIERRFRGIAIPCPSPGIDYEVRCVADPNVLVFLMGVEPAWQRVTAACAPCAR